jgi:caa(3)-type oxidase subunit IV
MAEHAEHDAHAHPSYVKIWGILLVLLVISVAGPFLGIQVVTLITAFGIAVVKAYLVAKHFMKHFMHITLEKRFIVYMTATVLVFMFLFFAGTAPDVMKPEGHNWVKPGWVEVDIEGDLGVHGEHH